MAKPTITQSDFDARIQAATEIDYARLAAYIDGEGTIMIAKTNVKTGRKTPTYVLALIVANTDLRLIEWLSQTFGMSVYFSHSESQRKWSKQICYSCRVFDKRAAVVLKRCLPYFICKRQQADTGLAFRRLVEGGSRGRKLTSVDLQHRERYRNKIGILNGSREKLEREQVH